MKLTVALLLVCAVAAPQSQDRSGHDAGGRKAGDAARLDGVLASRNRVEALTDIARVEVAPGCALELEPGVRFSRLEEGFSFATYDGSNVEFAATGERVRLASPVTARLTERGWDLGNGKVYPAAGLVVRRKAQQDDADSNLKSMQESAKKLRAKNQADQSGRKIRVRWLYGENPMVTCEIFNSPAIQQLVHISPLGF